MTEDVNEVTEALEPVIETVRGFSPATFLGGIAVGAGLGATAGYFFARKKLQTKYADIAEAEISEMREHYRAKVVAVEGAATKPELEALVRDKGYSSEPPMAVTPPAQVVEAAEEAAENADPRPEPKVENIFNRPRPTEEEVGMPLIEDNWDYERERSRRSPNRPYVIHRDEKDENDEYDTVTYTYYEEDDVLCNEGDDVIDKEERDALIGEANLNKFGHGSGDASVVYIRNDRLEMQMEVVRSPNSYVEEVHGFTPDIQHSDDSLSRRHRRERSRRDDE